MMKRLRTEARVAVLAMVFVVAIHDRGVSTEIEEYRDIFPIPFHKPLVDSQELIEFNNTNELPQAVGATAEASFFQKPALNLRLSDEDESTMTKSDMQWFQREDNNDNASGYVGREDEDLLRSQPSSLPSAPCPSKHPRSRDDEEPFLKDANHHHKKAKKDVDEKNIESALSKLKLNVPCPKLIKILMPFTKGNITLINVRRNLLLNIPQRELILDVEAEAKNKEMQQRGLAAAIKFRTLFDKVTYIAEQQFKDLNSSKYEEQLKLKWQKYFRDIIQDWVKIKEKDKQLVLERRELQEQHAVRMENIYLLADSKEKEQQRKKEISDFGKKTKKREEERKENISQAESLYVDLEDILSNENAFEETTDSILEIKQDVQSQMNRQETIYLCRLLRAYCALFLPVVKSEDRDILSIDRSLEKLQDPQMDIFFIDYRLKNLQLLRKELASNTSNDISSRSLLLKTYEKVASKFVELIDEKQQLLGERKRLAQERLVAVKEGRMQKEFPKSEWPRKQNDSHRKQKEEALHAINSKKDKVGTFAQRGETVDPKKKPPSTLKRTKSVNLGRPPSNTDTSNWGFFSNSKFE